MIPRDIDVATFDQLAGHQAEHLISLILPTEVKGPEVLQNRTRLGNLLRAAEDQLEAAGWRPRRRSEHLARALDLLTDEEFIQHQRPGLALYVGAGGAPHAMGLVSRPPMNLVVVAGTFHVRHLLPSLQAPQLRALVLTRGAVRLYETSWRGTKRLDADLPSSLRDTSWFTDRESQLQQHSDRTGSAAHRHGHDPSEWRSEDLLRFLRLVADRIPEPDNSGPLLLLGDDELAHGFAEIHSGEHLFSSGNRVRDADDAGEIQDQAAPSLESVAAEREKAALTIAEEHLGRSDGEMALAQALEAAIAGRVGQLIVSGAAAPHWGRLDVGNLTIEEHGEQRPGDVDLLDRLVVHAHTNGAHLDVVSGPIRGHDFVALPRF